MKHIGLIMTLVLFTLTLWGCGSDGNDNEGDADMYHPCQEITSADVSGTACDPEVYVKCLVGPRDPCDHVQTATCFCQSSSIWACAFTCPVDASP